MNPYLDRAKRELDTVYSLLEADDTHRIKLPPEMSAMCAIAGALIAAVEQNASAQLAPATEMMPEFVRIEDRDIRVDDVIRLIRRGNQIEIHHRGGDRTTLYAEYARIFLAWWDKRANVARLYEEPGQ